MSPVSPSLYQINTRAWLTRLSKELQRAATVDDIPDSELDRWTALGFDWIWLLSVWQTGAKSRQVSRSNPEWRREFQETLPDLREEDIAGSGFAVAGYTVSQSLGGDAALARLHTRLQRRGLRLMLDFVPNHTGLDHPWVEEHPEFYIAGTKWQMEQAPANYTRVKRKRGGEIIVAHGRDPYFPGWPDTLQLNYANRDAQDAMVATLLKIAGQCDGLRCDMAMLLLPEIFQRTWGVECRPFWPRAIEAVRARHREFCLLAEVYWDLEWTLQQQGFNYTYDKRLYDRLRAGEARPVREHFCAAADYQVRSCRFLENHDETRAASAFSGARHQAAAVLTYFCPGLRFFHQGQLEGRRKRLSPHLVRWPEEPVDTTIEQSYAGLLAAMRHPAVREGEWRLLECAPAWDGNRSCEALIAFAWELADRERVLVTVNYADHYSQGYVRLPFGDIVAGSWQLKDLLSETSYERGAGQLSSQGLYLDIAPWHCHAFQFNRK